MMARMAVNGEPRTASSPRPANRCSPLDAHGPTISSESKSDRLDAGNAAVDRYEQPGPIHMRYMTKTKPSDNPHREVESSSRTTGDRRYVTRTIGTILISSLCKTDTSLSLM